jgi:hypothetical protein
MDEMAARFWTVVFGGVTALGLIIGGIYTVIQFVDSRKKDQETLRYQIAASNLTAKQYFTNKLLDDCSAVATAAATVATGDSAQQTAAKGTFWVMYWGPMRVVAGDDVGASLDELARCLKLTDAANARPACKSREQLAAEIGRSCQRELYFRYDLKRPPGSVSW